MNERYGRKKTFSGFLILLMLLFSFGGCGRADNMNEELNMMISAPPVTIDPQRVSDVSSGNISALVTTGLYMYDENNDLVPGLAESYEVSDDGLTVTYHLRKGLKWSDGSPLSAEDFVYGIQRLADPDTKSNAVYMITDCCVVKNAPEVSVGQLPVSELGVSAPDHYTFVLELEVPCSYLNSLLAKPNFAPCSRSFQANCGSDYATSPGMMLSSGPFVIDRYEPLATQIHLIPNPYYFREGYPKLKGINLQVVSDLQQSAMCYDTGLLDITSIGGAITDYYLGDPNIKSFDMSSIFFIYLNQGECKGLKNKNIRKALAKCIDRESICKNVLKLGSSPLTRMSPPGYYEEEDGTDFSGDPDLYRKEMGYEPEQAKEYWRTGMADLGISELEIGLSYPPAMSNIAEVIKNQTEKNLKGLTITLKPVTDKEYVDKAAKGEGYEMLIGGWVADYADPSAFLSLMTVSQSGLIYNNQEYEDKIKESAGIVGQKKVRDQQLHNIEQMLIEDAACIPLYSKQSVYLIRKGIEGFLTASDGTVVLAGATKEVE
ncbi:MAG: peptide ABC transporter substrate-binding protein [Eubacterium sp.]|nr:peptide ABC transporter substrate-binding protein [Eubacterium sp.]